jgi:hypothetical protein
VQRGSAQLVVGHQHEVVEPVPEDALGQLERDAGGQSLGGGGDAILHQGARAPGAVGRRGGIGLHADHLQPGTHRAGDHAGAGGAAAATHGEHEHIHVGAVLERFQGSRGHSGDQQRLVSGMHVAPAPACRLGLAEFNGIVEVGPALDHLGAERMHRGQLDRVGRLGNSSAETRLIPPRILKAPVGR